jgi:hypothetical protein
MSVVCSLRRVTNEVATKLLEEPELINDFLGQPRPQTGGLIGRLFGRKPAKETYSKVVSFSRFDGDEFDTDKAWHGIHYLLTGRADEGTAPLNFLFCGGDEVGDIDVGYGPARVLIREKVLELNGQLSKVSEAELRSRFNPKAMMDASVYPEIWDRDPKKDDTLGYLMESYRPLQSFVSEAAKQQQAIVIWMT